MKKIISLFLSAVIILSAFTFSGTAVFAKAKTYSDKGYTYTILSDKTVEIKNYKGKKKSIKIPSKIKGKKVTSINGIKNNKKLTSVTIPNSVKNIKSFSFYNCKNLKTIKLGKGIRSIGANAFTNTAYCNKKENRNNGVLYIGKYLLKCDSAVSGNVVIKSGTVLIANNAFLNCISVTGIEIPDSVKYINSLAFAGCTSLSNISVPDTLSKIGSDAFRNTEYVNNESNYENGICYLSSFALKVANGVENAVFKEGTTSVNNYAFSDHKSLKSITLPKTLTELNATKILEGEPFVNLKEITVAPENEKFSSKDGVLYNNSRTKLLWYPASNEKDSFAVPSTVKTIAPYAFTKANIKTVTVSKNTKKIGKYAFNGAAVSKVKLRKGLKSIGEFAFYNCRSLKSVTVPRSVKEIGNLAFGFYWEQDENEPYDDGSNMFDYNFVVRGYKGSAAQKYCKKQIDFEGISYRIKFKAL